MFMCDVVNFNCTCTDWIAEELLKYLPCDKSAERGLSYLKRSNAVETMALYCFDLFLASGRAHLLIIMRDVCRSRSFVDGLASDIRGHMPTTLGRWHTRQKLRRRKSTPKKRHFSSYDGFRASLVCCQNSAAKNKYTWRRNSSKRCW